MFDLATSAKKHVRALRSLVDDIHVAWPNAAMENVPGDAFSVFLYHFPGLIEDVGDLNIDLYLAGHTHGGQIRLPFYGALVTLSRYGKKYEAGEYAVGDTILYVNRGIGMEGGLAPRVRFLCRPEITVFDIVPAKEPD